MGTEVYVEGGLITSYPATYQGFIHCADCHWSTEYTTTHNDLMRLLQRRLRDHRRKAHENDGGGDA